MGFLDKLKEKVKQACETISTGFAYVKEKVKKGVETAARKLEEWTERAHDYINKKREAVADWLEIKAEEQRRKKYENEVKRGKHKLKEEKPDVVLQNECIGYIKEKFPTGIKEAMHAKSDEERAETLVEIVHEVAEKMGVEVKVELDIPQSEADMRQMGCYNRATNELHINMGYVTCDKPELIAEQVYTVFHELIHARQWAIVSGEKDYGYSDERRMMLAQNFRYYIRPEVSDEAYNKQPLEAEAFGFEAKLKEAMSGLE